MAKKRPKTRRSQKLRRLIKTGSEENFRTKIGISQLELAMLLGVKKSAIITSEHRHRSLPSQPLIKLAQLEAKFETTKLSESKKQELHPGEYNTAIACSKAASKMLNRANKCDRMCYVFNRQYTAMTADHENTRKWIKIIEEMLEETNASADKADHAIWELLRFNAMKRLNKCGIAAQSVLKNKIDLLTAEAALNRKMEKEFRKGLPEGLKIIG